MSVLSQKPFTVPQLLITHAKRVILLEFKHK